MSLFSKNNTTPDPSDDRLREWGDAERAAPVTKHGRFAGVADRLTRGASASVKPRYSPFLVWSGASVLTAAVACSLYTSQTDVVAAPESPTVVTSRATVETPAAPSNPKAALANSKTMERLDNGLSGRVDPCFMDGATFGVATDAFRETVTPFVVTLKNDGAAFHGKIVARNTNDGRTHTYPVTVAGNGKTTRTTIYPNSSAYGYDSTDITLHTPTGTVDLGRPLSVIDQSRGDANLTIAILDERIGVLSRRLPKGQHSTNNNYAIAYGKPRNAPERAVGYDAVDALFSVTVAKR